MEEFNTSFSNSLSLNKNALDYYSTLSLDEQIKLNNFVNDAKTPSDIKFRTSKAIDALSNEDINFLELF